VLFQESEEELYQEEFLSPIENKPQKPVKKEEMGKDILSHQLNWIKSAIKTKMQDQTEEDNPFTITKETSENILSLVERTDPNSVFTIDTEELSKIEQDTIRSKEILSAIFGVEDKNNDVISVPKNNHDINFKIMALLLTQMSWSRSDVERICKENNVMIGSTLEAINDYSYRLINKIVIDEEDEKIYISTEYKEKLLCPKI
jgi:hypothetical protein